MNVTRTAWLAGLPLGEVAADDGRQPVRFVAAGLNLAHALISSGVVDTAVACGVEP